MWTTCQRGVSHWLWIPSHPQTHPRSSLKVSKWGGEGGRESENSPSCVAVLIRVYTNRPKEGSVAPVAVELALRAGVARRQQSLSRRPGWPPAKPHCIHSTLFKAHCPHCSQNTAQCSHSTHCVHLLMQTSWHSVSTCISVSNMFTGECCAPIKDKTSKSLLYRAN